MHDEPAALLVRNLLDVFNERDEARRLAVIQDVYTEHATFYEPDESFQGYERINKRVTEVLQTIPLNALFRVAGSPTRNHNLARLGWTLAAENEPAIASGMDVAILEGDRISALYLFIDGAHDGH